MDPGAAGRRARRRRPGVLTPRASRAAGSFIYLPLGVPHAFRITGATPARFLALTVPGGLMKLYDEVGVPAWERRLPGVDGTPIEEEIRRWNEIGPRYGLRVVGPPIPADR